MSLAHGENASRARRWAVAIAALALLAHGCAKHGPHAELPRVFVVRPPVSDSVTVGLWHLDERIGTRVSDSSPFRLDGTAGPDTRVDFGRFHNARLFPATAQSFVHVPYNPVMESPRGFTVEAWVYLNDYSRYELSGIAMRWTPVPNEQSWLLGVVGRRLANTVTSPSPGWFDAETATLGVGHLVFAFRPELAAGTQSFQSSTVLPTNRWLHVAATMDGEVVRLYLDGRLDVQVAVANGIHRSDAPLVLGNALDPRRLTEFGSDLRQDPSNLPLPFYALNGLVDEVRLSNIARREFEAAER